MRLLREGFSLRQYQRALVESAKEKNTLVVLPTGMGKTYVAIALAADRLEKYPESKALVLAPTRPLVNQHRETFARHLNLEKRRLLAVTGKIPPSKRVGIYGESRIIFATPQLIVNDVERRVLSLENFSLLVVDECHRSVKRYPYPRIAKLYVEQSRYPLILGLTASPGGDYERVKEICESLFIQNIEIRSERDEDVIPYVQPVKKKWITVELPDELKRIKALLEDLVHENVNWLKSRGWVSTTKPTKKELLSLQEELMGRYLEGERGNASLAVAMMKTIEAVKISHALELLETQGVFSLLEYLRKLGSSRKLSDRRVLNDVRVREAVRLAEEAVRGGVEHPKLDKLKHVVLDLLREDDRRRIIVFANYRSTVEKIYERLSGEGVECKVLIGQAMKEGRGLKQEEQIKILEEFNRGAFNVLIATSIGEEGLSIADVHTVIFYDNVASEIRRIQRYGRTGRTAPGNVVFFVTKGTRDEAYYWTSFFKERKMKSILTQAKKEKEKALEREKYKGTLFYWAMG